MGSAQEKTEKPTGKRLEDARKKGQIPKSREISTLAVLLGSVLISILTVRQIFHHFRQMVIEMWGIGISQGVGALIDSKLFIEVSYRLLMMLGPFCLLALLLGILGNVVQIKGFVMATEGIKPDLGKLDLSKGLTRLFSLRSLVEFAKSLVKMLVVGYAVYYVIRSQYQQFPLLVDQDLAGILQLLGWSTLKLVLFVCVVMVPVAALDFYYQRWQHEKDLKMTKQEVKQENKDQEGDPQVKSRIRSIQVSMARKRMMADVPKAEVIVTNPTHFAVALEYKPGMDAPKVVAKGMNRVAKKVIHVAREHRIPVVRNPPLARALYKQVKVGDTIPLELYKAVAKVLAYIYQQREKAANHR